VPALILAVLILLQPGRAAAHGVEATEGWWDVGLLLLLLLTPALYLVGACRLWHLSGPGRPRLRHRSAAFAAGWLVLAGSLLSPLHRLGEALFSVHMIEHELIMAVAAPLLVLSRPLPAFLWVLPRAGRQSFAALGTGRALRWATVPFRAWALHGLVLWLWHVPGAFDAAVRNEPIHVLQHGCFLAAALIYWWSLLYGRHGAAGYGLSVISLFATSMHTALLGALLTVSTQPWYPAYAVPPTRFGLTPIEDQQLAGLVMWVPAGVVYAGAALWLGAAWLQASEVRTRRWESALAAGDRP
jgi:cytochrome c oxidase assembly factor CtaG